MTSPAEPVRKRSHRRGRRLRRAIANFAILWATVPLIRVLAWTWRRRWVDGDRIARYYRGDGVLAGLWHGRLLVGLGIHSGRGIRVLVSASGDGRLIGRVLRWFGFGLVRGSSSRRAAGALREVLAALRAGEIIVITPDGPRGPRHAMHTRVAWLARESGRPVVALGYACDRAWRLSSWDRFTIPKPWARVAIVASEPILVAADTPDDQLAAIDTKVQQEMVASETRAAAALGIAVDW